MHKKTIDEVTKEQSFNKNLFERSMQMAQNSKKLWGSNTSDCKQIQQQIMSGIKIMSKLVNIKGKPTDVLVRGVEVLQELTDTIENYMARHKNNNAPLTTSKMQPLRPQTTYPEIKPFKQCDEYMQTDTPQTVRTDNCILKSNSFEEKCIYVSTEESLAQMIDQLGHEVEIAVDLEHSNMSYEGFTCLIQISSRKKDYIIDVFPIWKNIGNLQSIIGNPSITKIMHGADMDAKWLLRDFNIHIANLFDTYRAARVIGFPRFSYAYLLNHYCGVITDKQYQKADWRVRPLSKQMFEYARMDTHYLLQIWDLIRTDLHTKAKGMNLDPISVIRDIYDTSNKVANPLLQRFDYHYKDIYQMLKKDSSPSLMNMFTSLFELINSLAFSQDQSFDFLVPPRALSEVIFKIKELLNVSSLTMKVLTIKIDNIIELLKNQTNSKIGFILPKMKELLNNYFISSCEKKQLKTQKLPKKIIEKYTDKQQLLFKRVRNSIECTEYHGKSYGTPLKSQIRLNFEPIAAYLAQKHQISTKCSVDEQQQQIQILEHNSSSQHAESDEEDSQEEVINFKRMNPNVIYTIENEPQLKSMVVKKMNKQVNYENKIKAKTNNIYELLDDI